MSILIKNMEMPKSDDEYVIFTVYGDGSVVYGPLNRPHVRYKNRAVPVPPHGRLIESKAFLKVANETDYFSLDELAHLAVLVAATPTIIPAEEETT